MDTERRLTVLGELLEKDQRHRLETSQEYAKYLGINQKTLIALRYGDKEPRSGTLELVARQLGFSSRHALGAKLQEMEEERAAIDRRIRRARGGSRG